MDSEIDLLIVGGGISGLAAAFCAQRDGKDFLLLEANNRLGGCIRTDFYLNEFILERGPNSLAIGPFTEEITEALKIPFSKSNSKAKNKLVYAFKKLHPVSNPLYLFGSNFLPWKAKLAFFKTYKPKWQNAQDENIEEFFNYCFCKEITNKLIWPLLNGIYAGHPGTLSIQSVFPSIYEAAQNSNNLILGLLKKVFNGRKDGNAKTKRRKKEIISFPGGLGAMVQAIQRFLPPSKIKLNSPVKRIFLEDSFATVELTDSQTIKAKKIILAIPAYKAAELAPELFSGLNRIRYAPVSSVNLICDEKYFDKKTQELIKSSFGFLTARNQDIQVLGIIFSSALFANRCPEGKMAFTCFVGGINNPEALHLLEGEITDLCLRDLKKVFSLETLKAEFSLVTKWHQGIPQYEIGHKSLIEAELPSVPNIVLAGNYLRGVSIEEAVKSGFEAYERTNLKE